jgi:hypothetical protein
MFCEFFTAFVTNIFISLFLMKNVQNYFLLDRKLIGIKKGNFLCSACRYLLLAWKLLFLYILYISILDGGVSAEGKSDQTGLSYMSLESKANYARNRVLTFRSYFLPCIQINQ